MQPYMLSRRRKTRQPRGFTGVTHYKTRLLSLFVLVVIFVFVLTVHQGWPTIANHSSSLSSHKLPANIMTSVDNETRYVSLCPERMYGKHRTGNHLFLLAAMLYLAEKTGRTLLMPSSRWVLDSTFQLDPNFTSIQRFDAAREPEKPCPCGVLMPANLYNGDERFDTVSGLTDLARAADRTLALCGLYQTYRYAEAVRPSLRRLLRFRPEVRREADRLLEDARPAGWTRGSYRRVGVHVRRGDYLAVQWRTYGLTVVDMGYQQHAVDYFVSKYNRVEFVVATDDWHWTRETFSRMLADWRQTTGEDRFKILFEFLN
jgi:hypothetical protein